MENEYELLMYNSKWLLWIMNKVPHNIAMKIYYFCTGIQHSLWAFQVWSAIMSTDYKTCSKRTFGLNWFDEFYGVLNRGIL
jgi:hypothetical protein